MQPKRSIRAKEIAADIGSGMTDLRLMAKYRLTSRGLDAVYRKLGELKLIVPRESGDKRQARSPAQTENLDFVEPLSDTTLRISPRQIIDFPLRCYDADDPETIGDIRDLSEEGIGVKGLQSRPIEIRTLVIPISELYMPQPVVLEAICRWSGRDETDGAPLAGFEVTKFVQGSLQEILDLIRALTLEERAHICRRETNRNRRPF
jgi:hypothetical protein